MKKRRNSAARAAAVPEEAKAGASTQEPSGRNGPGEQGARRAKERRGGMDAARARRIRGLEEKNRKLKRTVAELTLDVESLKGVLLRKR